MDLRDFIPAVKYGASLQNSALAAGKLLIGNTTTLAQERAFGTVQFTVRATVSTGTVTVSNPSILLSCLPINSNGSLYLTSDGTLTVVPIQLAQSRGTVTWSLHTAVGGGGSIVYEVVYLPY